MDCIQYTLEEVWGSRYNIMMKSSPNFVYCIHCRKAAAGNVFLGRAGAVTQMPSLTLTRCSAWPFNMTKCGMTPAVLGFLPCHFLLNTTGTVSFPCHQMTGICCGMLMRGREGSWRETTGRLVLHFPCAIQYTESILQASLQSAGID